MGSIIDLILAIPRIWAMIKEIIAWVNKQKKESEDRANQEALDKLKNAQTEEEIKDATRDLANHP